MKKNFMEHSIFGQIYHVLLNLVKLRLDNISISFQIHWLTKYP
jgi:hypothetical protein